MPEGKMETERELLGELFWIPIPLFSSGASTCHCSLGILNHF